MSNNTSPAIEPLRPIRFGPRLDVHFARGIRAGRWVFATGQMAQDNSGSIAADVLCQHLPQRGEPRFTREASRLFDNVEETLRAGGTNIHNTARLDQYYRTHKTVDPYHLIRLSRFSEGVPPSTSIVMNDLLVPEATIELQAIAIVPDEEFYIRPAYDPALDGPPESGFPMGLCAGDYIFLSGNVASPKADDPSVDGVASKARMREHSTWWGQPILLETEYIVRERMEPALEQVGSSLENVVKAQVYLTDIDEAAAFNQAWSRCFPSGVPATTIIPCTPNRLGVPKSRIEINMLALRKAGDTIKQEIEADVFSAFEGHPLAVRAGDLLCLSGLMAVDNGGVPDLIRCANSPARFGSTTEGQAECILENAERICRAAGTSLNNVVRIQQFHTNLDEFYATHKVWQQLLPDIPLPYSAIGVPGSLPVPGCTILMDLWVYIP